MYQGSASKAMRYFSKLGFSIPNYSNPADHFIKALSISYPKTDADIAKLDHFTLNYSKKIQKKLIENFYVSQQEDL